VRVHCSTKTRLGGAKLGIRSSRGVLDYAPPSWRPQCAAMMLLRFLPEVRFAVGRMCAEAPCAAGADLRRLGVPVFTP
jgi:hypothetical protein